MKLNKTDVGCHADGALGHAHVRAVLADLVSSYCKAPVLVRELNADMSDDASEEDEAIDLLNSTACEQDVHFELSDGDLVLVSDADRCPDCGAGEGHFQGCPANL